MENTIREMCFSMGMIEKHNENPFGCGNFFIGDNLNSQGYFWYLSYKKHFIIAVRSLQKRNARMENVDRAEIGRAHV